MVTLVAESGSTKTDWMMVASDGSRKHIRTFGINPLLLTLDEIHRILKDESALKSKADEVSRIFFYGAGCGNKEAVNRLRIAFNGAFPSAQVEVSPDTLAAARACCGNQPGVIGILGTGANAGFYDGAENFTPFVPSLGFILGDEGSGNWIGRKLIADYFYKRMPEGLMDAFEEEFRIDYQEIITKVYRSSAPNAYLASFAPFASQHKGHPYCQSLIVNGVSLFLNRFIDPALLAEETKVHFAGSVAYAFQDLLQEQLESKRLNLGAVVRRPLEGLVDYHLK